jgi:hypothetical protein
LVEPLLFLECGPYGRIEASKKNTLITDACDRNEIPLLLFLDY